MCEYLFKRLKAESWSYELEAARSGRMVLENSPKAVAMFSVANMWSRGAIFSSLLWKPAECQFSIWHNLKYPGAQRVQRRGLVAHTAYALASWLLPAYHCSYSPSTHLTPALMKCAVENHRITESQNSRGWKGPLWVI